MAHESDPRARSYRSCVTCLGRILVVALVLAAAPLASAATDRPRAGDELLREFDSLWSRRKEPRVLDHITAIATTALREDPKSYGAAWRLAKVYCWRSQSVKDPEAIKKAALQGAHYGDIARELNPDGVEGQFLYAFAVGIYASNIGITEVIFKGFSSKFESAVKRAYDLDKNYEDGSPIVALGRYYFQLPWPLRDLDRSLAYLEEARQTHPNAMFGRVYLAETYYTLGRKDDARQELEYVVAADPSNSEWDKPMEIAREKLTEWFGTAVAAKRN
jgi:tetratricopeptide (TPR) repeat protein